MTPFRIAHVVNPVRARPDSDLVVAQPITFASILAARETAVRAGVDVELYCVHYPEDRGIAGAEFVALPELSRSVLDVGSFREQRKYPLIADILDTLHAHSTADTFVFSNADIGLMPYFYVALRDLIAGGTDAMVINRRTVSARFRSPQDLPLIYAEAGQAHPGFDCFVFPRSSYPGFELANVCNGVPPNGRALLLNLITNARKCELLTDAHLTFHLGDDRAWQGDRLADYNAYNLEQFRLVVERLRERIPQGHALLPTILDALEWKLPHAGAGAGEARDVPPLSRVARALRSLWRGR